MCLKILPICLILFAYFWRVHVLLSWATFPIFVKDDLFPSRSVVTFLDSATSHTTFTVVAIFHSGLIFPEIPGTSVTLSLFTIVSYKLCTFV